jgi:hypothetical protein
MQRYQERVFPHRGSVGLFRGWPCPISIMPNDRIHELAVDTLGGVLVLGGWHRECQSLRKHSYWEWRKWTEARESPEFVWERGLKWKGLALLQSRLEAQQHIYRHNFTKRKTYNHSSWPDGENRIAQSSWANRIHSPQIPTPYRENTSYTSCRGLLTPKASECCSIDVWNEMAIADCGVKMVVKTKAQREQTTHTLSASEVKAAPCESILPLDMSSRERCTDVSESFSRNLPRALRLFFDGGSVQCHDDWEGVYIRSKISIDINYFNNIFNRVNFFLKVRGHIRLANKIRNTFSRH